MFPLFLLIFISIILALCLDTKVTRIIAPVTYALLLMLYALAIIGKAHYGFIAFCIICVGIYVFYIIKKRRFFPSFKTLVSSDSVFSWGFFAYLAILGILFISYSNNFVFNWDDFHYNALFPKDMYFYKTMPTGWMNASEYKDYKPLMQLFFFWGFKGSGRFSEPLMFQYKLFLIYTAMMPLFELADRALPSDMTHTSKLSSSSVLLIKRIVLAVIIFILPFAFLFEVTISLSMDAFMAVLFAYLVIMIVYETRRDYITYFGIVTALLCLTLVKSIALMFAGIVIGIWFVTGVTRIRKEKVKADTDDNKSNVSENSEGKILRDMAIGENEISTKLRIGIFALSCILTAAAYLSWTVFCKLKGNSTYLSDALMSNLKDGIVLPSYGADTIRSFNAAIITMQMNLGTIGLPLIGVIILCILAIIYVGKKGTFDITDGLTWGVLGLGMLVYIAFLLYSYLFIFYDWEAESLSSLDRYFGTYALVITITAIYMIACKCEAKMLLPILTGGVILVATLNFHSFFVTLIPPLYERENANLKVEADEAAAEAAQISPTSYDMGVVLVVSDSGNDMYSRSLDYDMVPLVSKPFNVAEHENTIEDIYSYIDTFDVRYVYFTRRLENHLGLSDYAEMTEDGELRSGCLYAVDENNMKLRYCSGTDR